VALLSHIIVQELALPPSLDDAMDHYNDHLMTNCGSTIHSAISSLPLERTQG
jgi:hypothetical protein